MTVQRVHLLLVRVARIFGHDEAGCELLKCALGYFSRNENPIDLEQAGRILNMLFGAQCAQTEGGFDLTRASDGIKLEFRYVPDGLLTKWTLTLRQEDQNPRYEWVQ